MKGIKLFLGILSILFLSKEGLSQVVTPPNLVVTPTHWQIPINEMINMPVADMRVTLFDSSTFEYLIEKTASDLQGLPFKDGSPYFVLKQRGPNAFKVYLAKSLAVDFKPGDQLTLSISAKSGDFTTRKEIFIEIEEAQDPPPFLISGNSNNSNHSTGDVLNQQQSVNQPKWVNASVGEVVIGKGIGNVSQSLEGERNRNVTSGVSGNEGKMETSTQFVIVLVPVLVIFPVLSILAWLLRHKLNRLRKFCCEKEEKDDDDDDLEKDEMKGDNTKGEFTQELHFKSEGHRKVSSSASSNSHLYSASPKGNGAEADTARILEDSKWEFPRHQLKIVEKVGEGCFGQVWKYEAENIGDSPGTTIVAVKTLRNSATEKEKRDLLHELSVMKLLDPHPNVVRLLGSCTEKDPIYIILEFVNGGTLQDFLRLSRSKHNYRNLHGESQTLTARDLTSFAFQVAKGMAYLSSKKVVHRDLAARNILIDEDHVCKVADFGFARDVMANNIYERKSEGRLPIRWMAPESLYDNVYTTKSDVWSFGVLMWEIVALGSTPYPGKSASEVMVFIKDTGRLEKPPHCDRRLYNIMSYCWSKEPEDRPEFVDLVDDFEKLLVQDTDYIDLNLFPEHAYYNEVGLSDEKV